MMPQSEHIAVKYHFFKNYVHQSDELVQLVTVNTEDQITNCMTETKFQQAWLMLASW